MLPGEGDALSAGRQASSQSGKSLSPDTPPPHTHTQKGSSLPFLSLATKRQQNKPGVFGRSFGPRVPVSVTLRVQVIRIPAETLQPDPTGRPHMGQESRSLGRDVGVEGGLFQKEPQSVGISTGPPGGAGPERSPCCWWCYSVAYVGGHSQPSRARGSAGQCPIAASIGRPPPLPRTRSGWPGRPRLLPSRDGARPPESAAAPLLAGTSGQPPSPRRCPGQQKRQVQEAAGSRGLGCGLAGSGWHHASGSACSPRKFPGIQHHGEEAGLAGETPLSGVRAPSAGHGGKVGPRAQTGAASAG